MYKYTVYGLIVASDIELPEAFETEYETNIDVEIRAGLIKNALLELTTEEPSLEVDYKIYAPGGCQIKAYFVNQGFFLISNGKEITYELCGTPNLKLINQIILCYALNLILMQQSIVGLHGSGVIVGNKGVVICGESGAGKSTLTSELINRGAGFFADDMVVMREEAGVMMGYSSFPQRKLWPDSLQRAGYDIKKCMIVPDFGKDKYGIYELAHYFNGSIEINSIVILEAKDVMCVRVKEIVGNTKVKYVLNHVFGKSQYPYIGFGAEEFAKCVAIADKASIYILERPISRMTVEEQVEKLSDVGIGLD